MKRIALFFILSVLLCGLLKALARETTSEDEALAARLLPEYTYHAGRADNGCFAFLMTNPAGERVFVGGVYMEDGWVLTESKPLPEGAVMDSYHSGSSSFLLAFPHPEGVLCSWCGEEPVWIYICAYAQADGTWLVETILNENEDGFHINEGGFPGYYINATGMIYGTVTFERDMRYIDWTDFPLCLEDALAYLEEDMGVIGADALLLYADAACTQIIAEYLYATPVIILTREGSLAQVRIADSDVIGWLYADSLLLGADQLIPDEDGEFLVTAEYTASIFDGPKGITIYDAPNGNIHCITEWPAWFTIMSISVDGWYHICFPESLESGWVRTEDGAFLEGAGAGG